MLVLLLVYFFITMGGAGFAYLEDHLRPDGDPKKRNFHILFVLFAPLAPFILIPLLLVLIILAGIAYGIFLITFTLSLLFFRQVTIFKYLMKLWKNLGYGLLEIMSSIARLLYKSLTAILPLTKNG